MKVAGFFTGHKSWEQPFIDAGHDVFMTDFNKSYYWCDFNGDFLEVTPQMVIDRLGGTPDVIVMSPPCTTFSIASCMAHWHPPKRDGTREPKSEASIKGLALLRHALFMVEELKPKFWIMENPRGLMRKMPETKVHHRETAWYCQYGDTRAKPTDLWGAWPHQFKIRAPCKNGNPECHHESAPRGSSTGTQGLKGNALRSLIPKELCKEWFEACEAAMANPGSNQTTRGQTRLSFFFESNLVGGGLS